MCEIYASILQDKTEHVYILNVVENIQLVKSGYILYNLAYTNTVRCKTYQYVACVKS